MSRVRKIVMATPDSWFKTTLFKLTMFLVVFVTLPTLFFIQASLSKKALQNASSSDSTFDWVMPDPPLSRAIANYPTTPQLLAVERSQAENSVAGYDPGSLSLKLKHLIETHPLSIVNHDLYAEIDQGEILINWQPAQGAVAQFQVVPVNALKSISLQQSKQLKEMMPTLTIDPEWLAELMAADEIILSFLVLFHEYVHFQQYKAGDERTKRLFGANFLSEVQRQRWHITQIQGCEHMWMTESDAYAQECRIANEWGFPFGDQFCLYVDSPLWSQALFSMIFNSPTLDPKYRAACIHIYAKLAGHPHPELITL